MPPALPFRVPGFAFVPRRSGGRRRRRQRDQRCSVEPLEPRALLAVTVLEPLVEIPVAAEQAELELATSGYFRLVEFGTEISGTLVRVDVNQPAGDTAFFMELFDEAGVGRTVTTPKTVANFLKYVDAGLFGDTIIHRSVPGFVVQGGGFTAPLAPIGAGGGVDNVATFPAVVNEPGNTNVRGTVAMAKLGGDPDSATSQWFVNLADNSANLDAQNGGFTVFARVLGDGMELVDSLAAVPTFNYGGAFTNLPLRTSAPADVIPPEQFVIIERVATVHPFAYEVVAGPGLDASIDPATGGLSVTFAPGFAGRSEVVVRASSFVAPDFVTAGQFGETRFVIDRAAVLPADDGLPPQATFAPVGTPRGGVDQVRIDFSEPVANLGVGSFELRFGRRTVPLTGASLTAVGGSDTAYVLSGLAAATARGGTYTLVLDAGYTDLRGNRPTAPVALRWLDVAGRPGAVAVPPESPEPAVTPSIAPLPADRTTPLDTASVRLSEALASFDPAAVGLTRDGRRVSLRGMTVSGGGTSWLVSNLGRATARPGEYVLTVDTNNAPAGDDLSGMRPLTGIARAVWRQL